MSYMVPVRKVPICVIGIAKPILNFQFPCLRQVREVLVGHHKRHLRLSDMYSASRASWKRCSMIRRQEEAKDTERARILLDQEKGSQF